MPWSFVMYGRGTGTADTLPWLWSSLNSYPLHLCKKNSSNIYLFLQCVIVKLKMNKDRKSILDRRAKGRLAALGKDKGKYTEETATAMETS